MSSTFLRRVDHLVYATPDLEVSLPELEKRLGVRPSPGGVHPGMGTRNALLSLGARTYLEVLAPDPAQARPRWFGMDRLTAPRLLTWAAKVVDLTTLLENRGRELPLGRLIAGKRDLSGGERISWQMTHPDPLPGDGILPFLIDWGESRHPAGSAAAGCRLLELHARHPAPRELEPILRTLDLDLRITPAPAPALVAVIDSPRGIITLT